jgi:hypothetical protein
VPVFIRAWASLKAIHHTPSLHPEEYVSRFVFFLFLFEEACRVIILFPSILACSGVLERGILYIINPTLDGSG